MNQNIQLLAVHVLLMKQGYLVRQLLFGVNRQCTQKFSSIVHSLFHSETDKLHNGNLHVFLPLSLLNHVLHIRTASIPQSCVK